MDHLLILTLSAVVLVLLVYIAFLNASRQWDRRRPVVVVETDIPQGPGCAPILLLVILVMVAVVLAWPALEPIVSSLAAGA